MPIDLSERTDSMKRSNRRRLNLDEYQAVLGRSDTKAVANPRMPGRVWVAIYASNGLLGNRSALAPTKYFDLRPDTPIKLKYDVRGRLQVDEPDADAQLTTGVDPVAQAVQQNSNSTAQSDFETLRVIPTDTPSLSVQIKAWKIYVNGVFYVFPGDSDIDMSPYVPSTGLMRYAMIALKADYETIEVTTSTPRSVSDVALNVDDENECAAALSGGSTPIQTIKLVGDQSEITQSDIDLDGQDERQLVNNSTSMTAGTMSVAIYEEQQTSGVNGGSSVSGNQTRAINTEVSDINNIATLSGNQITISAAGTYEIQFWATCFVGQQNQAYLYDITNSAALQRGRSSYTNAAVDSVSNGNMVIVLVSARVIELRHYITAARSLDGLGTAVSQGTEVYSNVTIRKIA